MASRIVELFKRLLLRNTMGETPMEEARGKWEDLHRKAMIEWFKKREKQERDRSEAE